MWRPRCLQIASALAALAAFTQALAAGEPPAAAVTTFETRIRETEVRLDALLQKEDAFLWADTAARRARLQAGEVVCEPRLRQGSLEAHGGLINHWVGAVFIPGVPVDRVLALVQNYDDHKNAYAPHVIASRGKRSGNDFRVNLRLQERALWVTVVLDTEYDVHYSALAGGDWRSKSYSRKIAEVANAGKPDEREKTVRESQGYLWQLNSYWLFRNRDSGTYVECEAVSLSRKIPTAAKILAPVFRPFIGTLPRNSLEQTLRATKELALRDRR